ncbi:MAG: acetylglutamate kinase [bacterium]|nr:acetylglutamate kinase [bacterium]
MYQERINKAKILLEALPYIKRFHGATIVIKYGGSLMVQEERKGMFAADIVLLKYVGMNPVIVHGGGKEISRWMEKLGKKAVFVDGLRVTDAETMEITEMVLSGKINNEVVSLINQAGGRAVGLSGKDARMFRAERMKTEKDRDLGQVGTVTSVDVGLIETLSNDGYIPVISSVGISEDGESLNMNADDVAAAVALGLGAKKLVYLTDVQGIMKDDNLIPALDYAEATELLNSPTISGGMKPKLECSLHALAGTVDNVHIINGSVEHAVLLELFTDIGIGTMITSDGK